MRLLEYKSESVPQSGFAFEALKLCSLHFASWQFTHFQKRNLHCRFCKHSFKIFSFVLILLFNLNSRIYDYDVVWYPLSTGQSANIPFKYYSNFFCTLLQRNYIFFTNLPGKILFSQENDFQHILLFQNIKDWAHRESLARSPTAGTYCSEYTCSAIFLFTSGSSKPSPCREHSFPIVLLSKTL